MKLEIKGKYTSAICMTDSVESSSISQLEAVCNHERFENVKIRVMPDVHTGVGCVVGFTAKVKDFAIPNLVGVDISCSVSAYNIGRQKVDFDKLDSFIRKNIMYGTWVRKSVSPLVSDELAEKVTKVCEEIGDKKSDRHLKAIGSLGGGNHFIEMAGKPKDMWLLIHTGSRNFGKQICEFHQQKAVGYNMRLRDGHRKDVLETVPEEDRQAFIESHNWDEPFNKQLAHLDGDLLREYIEHMNVAKEFAEANHKILAHDIVSAMKWQVKEEIMTNHNYIEILPDGMMIRKGAISAKFDEKCIIPLNMRDGSLICVGKGNDEWNQSAPHGAGRVLSRTKAKESLSLAEFQKVMKGVWSSCVHKGTLDESPMAYRNKKHIIESVGETVDIIEQIKPLYNFKGV